MDLFLDYISVAPTLLMTQHQAASIRKSFENNWVKVHKLCKIMLAVFAAAWQNWPSLGLQRAPAQIKGQSQSKLDTACSYYARFSTLSAPFLLPPPRGFPSFFSGMGRAPVSWTTLPHQNKEGFIRWVWVFIKWLTHDATEAHSNSALPHLDICIFHIKL